MLLRRTTVLPCCCPLLWACFALLALCRSLQAGIPVPIVLGDINGDFNVTTADAPLLVEALTNRPAYDAHMFPVNADINGDVNTRTARSTWATWDR